MRWAALVLVGCGRVGFDPTADALTDATGDAFDETRCTWSTPAALTALNSPDDESEPALSPDGTTIVFTSNRTGELDLYSATFDAGAWSAPQRIGALDSPSAQGGAAWSPTGDALYFTSFRNGPLGFYLSAYEDGSFGAPTRVSGLEGLTEQLGTTVRGDHLELFYSSRLSPSTIQRAVRSSTTAAWTPMGDVSELVASFDRGYPGVSSDGRVMYFAETRMNGRFTLARTTRPTIDAPFGAPELVSILDGGRNDGDPQPSADGSQLLMSSDRASAGDFDLYVSTRVCP